MKYWFSPAGLLLFSLSSVNAVAQGTLAPPGAPAPSMRTLQQIEPRTPITSLPYTITQPGSYYVESNLTAAVGSAGILIRTNDVSLDLQGFALIGATNSAYGVGMISVRRNILIRHGTIRGFTVGVDTAGADNSRYEDLRIGPNRGDGLRIGQYGVVENCSVMENSGDGIDGYQGCVLRGCVVSSNTLNGILVGADSTVVDCLAQDNTLAGIQAGDGSTVERCQVLRSGTSGITLYRNSVVRECTVQDSNQAGILATNQSNLIELNRVARNGTGLQVTGQNNVVRENQVGQNGVNYDFAANNQLNLLLSEIPETLAWPCAVKLVGTLVCSVTGTNGITVTGNHVTIDMAGHALVGPGENSGSGIRTAALNLQVLNGKLVNWRGGLESGLYSFRAALLTDLQALTNDTGIYAGPGSVLVRCSAHENVRRGINTGGGCSLSGCAARHNGEEGIQVDRNGTLSDCVADYNGSTGIQAGPGSALNNCVANYNTGTGFVPYYSTLTGCSAINNTNDGVWATGGLITHCFVDNNRGHGIWSQTGCVISESVVNGNGEDGISVASRARVFGCEIDHNGWYAAGTGSGIHATGDGNRIENNLVTDNDAGITIDGSHNFISRNTAYQNDTNWVVAAGNVCLVVQAITNAVAINGNTGGVAPGNTDPNANFTF